MRLMPINCPNCSATLEIGPKMELFYCSYCGTKLIAERVDGTVALNKVEDAVARVDRGTQRVASELALQRLKQELAEVEKEIESSFGDPRRRVDTLLREDQILKAIARHRNIANDLG